MSLSILSLLSAILPVAGVLFGMKWSLRQGDTQSRLIANLTCYSGRSCGAFALEQPVSMLAMRCDSGNKCLTMQDRTSNPTSSGTSVLHIVGIPLVLLLSTLVVSQSASAHEIPWRKGESRQVGFGSCSKGACMKLTCWSKSKPHRHLHGKVVFDGRGDSSCWSSTAKDSLQRFRLRDK